MRSKVLWNTDLGLTKVGSGELSPGLHPIELRFYPVYGHGLDEWSFEVGVLKGNGSVKVTKESFSDEDKFFKLMLSFKESMEVLNIQIFATHERTNFTTVVWEGEILPNRLHVKSKVVGLSTRNFDVLEELKKVYPNLDPRHFKLPTIDVLIPQNAIQVAVATSDFDHTDENAPIVFKGFHKDQTFQLEVNGFVIGYGGRGGNAGMSTVTDEVDILYPTDALDGGNTVYVEHETQKVLVTVARHGCFVPGQGGKGASSFAVNCPEKRIRQIGHPGVGGYPNGLNGSVTDIHYKLNLVKESSPPKISTFGHGTLHYSFDEGVYVGHELLPTNGSSIKATKDGKQGLAVPKGVKLLANNRTQPLVKQLVHAFGTYVEL